jgi:hypothetical protein
MVSIAPRFGTRGRISEMGKKCPYSLKAFSDGKTEDTPEGRYPPPQDREPFLQRHEPWGSCSCRRCGGISCPAPPAAVRQYYHNRKRHSALWEPASTAPTSLALRLPRPPLFPPSDFSSQPYSSHPSFYGFFIEESFFSSCFPFRIIDTAIRIIITPMRRLILSPL